MMKFSYPAAYAPFIKAKIALMIAEIGRDVYFRAEDKERLRRFASVPDSLMDGAAIGREEILVGIPEAISETSDVTAALSTSHLEIKTA